MNQSREPPPARGTRRRRLQLVPPPPQALSPEKVIEHPAVGQLALRQTVLQVVDDSRTLYLILYTPAPDTDTAEKLQKLAVNAGGNR
jgi:hypothetical protein